MDCFPLFHWWKNFSERNNFFLPTHRFSFLYYRLFIYICNPQKEVIISWICCCDDLVISREKVHMMNSHFFYMLAFDWLGFPDFFYQNKTLIQSILYKYTPSSQPLDRTPLIWYKILRQTLNWLVISMVSIFLSFWFFAIKTKMFKLLNHKKIKKQISFNFCQIFVNIIR